MQIRKQYSQIRNHQDIGSIYQNDLSLRVNKSKSIKHKHSPKQRSSFNKESSITCKYCNNSYQQNNVQFIKILKDENQNLKQQNKFLNQKITKLMKNEKDFYRALSEYEVILSTLNLKNSQLHQNIQQCTNINNLKARKLKTCFDQTLQTTQKRDNFRETPIINHNQNQFNGRQLFYQKQNYVPLRRNQTQKHMSNWLNDTHNISINQKYNSINTSNYRFNACNNDDSDNNYEFERMLEVCHHEKDLEMKKLLRKKLADFTYKKSAVMGYLD